MIILSWASSGPYALLFERETCYKLLTYMNPEASEEKRAKILAHSPGRYPILVMELPVGGELRTLYYETDYDPQRTKPVNQNWLQENAIGRHDFVELDPPREVPLSALKDYVRRELLEGL
jgi:hypothetical protein